ncbi:hypothetical protein [Streptomyces fumanus]|uniref:hypothetical protein n=1 Tax=Streptomyces fumanus TaxID=67302 RepID=UPI0033E6EFF2
MGDRIRADLDTIKDCSDSLSTSTAARHEADLPEFHADAADLELPGEANAR